MNRLLRVAFCTFVMLLAAGSFPAAADELYHLVLIPNPSPETILAMAQLGLPLDDAHPGRDKGLEIPLSESDLALLNSQGLSYQIIQSDLAGYYEQICRHNLQVGPPPIDTDPVHMKYGSMGGYYTFAQITADLDSMRLLYPNLCTAKSILGYGWNNNPIYMVKISDNPDLDENEPEGLYDALHHAREPGSYTATLYAMWYLLENYGTDPEATYLVNNRELYFVPVVNPDGLLHNQQTNPNGGGMWRKNRRNNGSSYGVDLNRNYTYQWGYDNIGSSPTPSSETYRGPSAGSEPETQALMNFTDSRNISTAMSIHTYSGAYLSAYGYANVLPEHYDAHMDYMNYSAKLNDYNYGACYDVMYAVNGGTNDWQLHQHDILCVGTEVGDISFWPPINYIMPEAAENLRAYLHQFWCAGGLVELSAINAADGALNPGSTENLLVTLFNSGWGTSEGVSYQLTTTDPYITLNPASAVTDTIPRRTSVSNAASPFVATISPSCPLGHAIPFTLTINQGSFIQTSQYTMYAGPQMVYFSDAAESGMTNWTVSNYWGQDNSNPHTGTYSFSDSPGRNYYNNTNVTMTLAQPLDLSNAATARLEFWTRCDLEYDYDFAQVEVSTNGTTWTPVGGNWTVAGSGHGMQTTGQPGYEGGLSAWFKEVIDLNSFAGQSYFKFRFEFKSDGGSTGNGFFVDDIQLLGYNGASAGPAVSIELTPISPPIQIPAGGGSFSYNATVTNNAAASTTFDAWIMTQLPTGPWYGPVLGPVNLTLAAGASLTRVRIQSIPAGAPAGTYTYRGYVGDYSTVKWDSSSFTFVKLGAELGGSPGAWENSGESFDPWASSNSSPPTPTHFALTSVYPNPFNPTAQVRFELPAASWVKLEVFDIGGHLIQGEHAGSPLQHTWMEAGLHEITLNGSNLPSGVYLLRLQAGELQASQKIVLMK